MVATELARYLPPRGVRKANSFSQQRRSVARRTTTATATSSRTRIAAVGTSKRRTRLRERAHRDEKEAVDGARELVRNQGGGEVRTVKKDGTFIDCDTVRGPEHKESPTRDRK